MTDVIITINGNYVLMFYVLFAISLLNFILALFFFEVLKIKPIDASPWGRISSASKFFITSIFGSFVILVRLYVAYTVKRDNTPPSIPINNDQGVV